MPPPSDDHLFGKKLSLLGPPNEGYTILHPSSSDLKTREKMVRAPRRTKYFYNILLLIALSLILYLFSSQLLSLQGGGGDGGGSGSGVISSSNSNDNSNVLVGRYRSSSSVSSLSNDFNTNYQKTGQLSSPEASVDGNDVDNNDDSNAIGTSSGDGESQNTKYDNKMMTTSSSRITTTGGPDEETQTSKDWLKMFSVRFFLLEI